MNTLSRYFSLFKISNKSSKKRKALRASGLLTASLVTTLIAIIESRLQQLTSPPRKNLQHKPEDVGLNYEDFEVTTSNQKRISGWFISPEQNGKNRTKKVVILSHGYGENRCSHKAILEMAKYFVENGVACILYDFENHGLIDGKKTSDDGMTTIGAKTEQNDLNAVIDYAKKRDLTDIGLIGISMGAATSLQVAAERDDIQMVFADSSFTSLDTYLREQISVWDHRIKPWMVQFLLKYTKYIKGVDVDNIRPIDAVQELGRRGVEVRFIHTKEDEVTPDCHSSELGEAYLAAYNQQHQPPKTRDDVLKLTEKYSENDEARWNHCRSIDKDPDGYKKFAVRWMIEHLGRVNTLPRSTKGTSRFIASLQKESSQKIPPIYRTPIYRTQSPQRTLN